MPDIVIDAEDKASNNRHMVSALMGILLYQLLLPLKGKTLEGDLNFVGYSFSFLLMLILIFTVQV